MRAIDYDTVFGGFLFDEHIMVAGSQERFARDAAHVQASATKLLVFFDQGSLQAELTRANGSNVAARPRTNDNNIKFFHRLANTVALARCRYVQTVVERAHDKEHLAKARC